MLVSKTLFYFLVDLFSLRDRHDTEIRMYSWAYPTTFINCNSNLFLYVIFARSDLQIYVVDSLDRERIGKAKAEFQV